MSARKHNRNPFEPNKTDRIIARAKQKRSEALRQIFGSMFGR